ncbi:hypothetical protein [Eubacterium limosum]|uniref:Uncharacterized protein n=1 Tax=Eubacterium limosum TaxID=1736 RepID=A0ABT5UPK4_EUBLI|nr:hypothetical protein [Eubacterium limosum]MCB6569164.1 hypothetical protein [Eubacterium limosum]MDE1470863.1 hypothetical protein [Eubacterium limosum]
MERDLGLSYRSLARARAQLEAAGRLRYQPAVKNSRGIYTLIPFAENLAPVKRQSLGGQTLLLYDYVDYPQPVDK